MHKYYYLFLSVLLAVQVSFSQAIIDGNQSEWNATTLIIDDSGDVSDNQLDILNVHMTDDEDFLYFKVETNREFNLDEEEDLTLYLDIDNNTNTGFFTQGLGTELSYFFSERFGFSELNGNVNHDDLDLFIAPTVSSSWYEFALSKDSPGLNLDQTNEIRCLITNGNGNDDQVGPYDYTLQNNQASEFDYSFDKVTAADFRIVSYNVRFDGWFEQGPEDDQRKIVEALNPDIIAFQEIYDHSTQEIRSSLQEILPSQTGWNCIHNWSDVYVFTTHEVIGTDAIDGNEISLLKVNGKDLVIVNVHLPCCDNNLERQQETDRILSTLRDRNTTGSLSFDFEKDTPIIITGDFNLVGEGQQYESFITGDIVFNSTFGPDVNLDSDGSGLADANLLQPHLPSNHTWYNQFSSFAPGKLDLFFYSDTSLKLQNGFVMNTAGLSNAILQEYNLISQTTVRASDHMPIVGDFSFENTSVNTEEVTIGKVTFYPNPASKFINIEFENLEVNRVEVIDLNGKLLINQAPQKVDSIILNTSTLHPGVYLIRILTNSQLITKSVVIQN